MNHCELQALRKLFMIDVSEAAEHIGHVSARTWQYWESSRYNIPDDVILIMSQLCQKRRGILDQLKAKHQAKREKGERLSLPYHQTFSSFEKKFPKSDVIAWRLHQSTTAEILANDDILLQSVELKPVNE